MIGCSSRQHVVVEEVGGAAGEKKRQPDSDCRLETAWQRRDCYSCCYLKKREIVLIFPHWAIWSCEREGRAHPMEDNDQPAAARQNNRMSDSSWEEGIQRRPSLPAVVETSVLSVPTLQTAAW